MIRVRLLKLEEAWTEFSALHNEVLELSESPDYVDPEPEFEEYEAKYFKAQSLLNKAIHDRKESVSKPYEVVVEKLADQQSSLLEKLNSSSYASSVNLPKFNIPHFSGDYKNWPSFRDLFTGSVDCSTQLTASQKFHFLKTFLRDEAANLVKHIPISDANYIDAWERLEERYERTNLIVQSFIQTYLTLPTMSVSNVHVLRKITDGADEVIRGLNALDSTGRDPWLVYLLMNKLDSDTKQAWAEKVASGEDPNIVELLRFLKSRCNALESCQPISRPSASRNKPQNQIRSHFVESQPPKPKCPLCKEDHLLSQCSRFVALDIEPRRDFVKNNSVCFNCLRGGHASNRCRSTFRCRVCKSRHHSLVHKPEEPNSSSLSSLSNSTAPSPLSLLPTTSGISSSSNIQQSFSNNHSLEMSSTKQTILPTILATARDNQNNLVPCRVLIDSGSQVSFVVESFVQRLGLHRKHARIPIVGLTSVQAGVTRGCVSLSLCSRINGEHLLVDAFILNKLTSNLPSQSFDMNCWPHIQNLQLADPHFNVSGPIDVLLGADKLWSILEAGQVKGPLELPIAQKTSFGWLISGELLNVPAQPPISTLVSILDVDVLLQRFWQIEEVTPPGTESFVDEAETHFRSTFSRDSDGKYVVQLPFKSSTPTFANSLKAALSRLFSMERRFKLDSELYAQYKKFMQEYIDLGHMVRIPPEELHTTTVNHFYLPHHAVLKPDSTTTKLRVVFDGSSRDSVGTSLNSCLLVGPPIQRDLLGVILRFRQHRYVVTADMVKMFRQVWVDDNHTDYQRIVWRNSPNDEIGHYRLRTVTYGTASAPYLSVRVLQQIAVDYKNKYPTAARVLLNDVYVDDIMTGADTEKDLLNLQSDLVALLAEARIELRKWHSNCWPLLLRLKNEGESAWVDTDRSGSMVKVLGMHWHPFRDIFSFRINESVPDLSLCRRSLLSEVASIFDPLGLLSPSIVLFKMLLQELWSYDLKLKWDGALPPQLSKKWMNYRQELRYFEDIKVPRLLFTSFESVELHGFSDASSLAYSAVVYARCTKVTGEVTVVLVAAKTKVAPLKPLSIPRLELCGALLLSRLITKVTSTLSIKFHRIFAWCDSEIVLHWLSSPPRRWTTFVCNRTAAILETLPRYSWNHVPSESNPADCASRGILPSKLVDHQIWWTGPSWLSLQQSLWPKPKMSTLHAEEGTIQLEERQSQRQVLSSFVQEDRIQMVIEKVTSWNKLQMAVAYAIRFISNCRLKKSNRTSGGLTLLELRNARNIIIRRVQQSSFGEEIRHLRNRQELPPKSKLLRYSAFLDSDEILRVGGRLKLAHVSFSLKHPIILPNNHFSSIVVTQIHQNNLHTGVSETFSLVRQQFWIMGSRNLVRKIVRTCKTCFMQRKTTKNQVMGDLPPPRVEPSRPFLNSGCDYAGPFTIKLSRGRNPKLSKAYFALFVCMSTKAVHLELVSDLTTDAFLAAFRRFVARRGKCANIYTDNATNFHGARRCLNEMQKLVLSQAFNDNIASSLALDGTRWHFIPPAAPHFGGLWEAGVKSVKSHLRRVVSSSLLTFEELYTVLTQIEAILNSRPLCSISDEDLNPLTPSHFLIGEPLTAVPEPNLLNTPVNRLSHWNHLQNMVQGFWKRWHTDYLTTLQERSKWQTPTDNIKVGDLVVVKEPNLPTTKWLLGRVEAVHPGTDSRVRVATLRTSRGFLVRPIIKLAVLPSS